MSAVIVWYGLVFVMSALSVVVGVAFWWAVERPLLAMLHRRFDPPAGGRSAAKRKAADLESSLSPTALPAP